MQTPDDHRKQGAISALIRIAALEGLLLMAVVGVYLKTNQLVHLIGGAVGVFLISGPVFFRWFKEHGKSLETKSNAGDTQSN